MRSRTRCVRPASAVAAVLVAALVFGSVALLFAPTARAASVSITLYGKMLTGWSTTPGGETNPGPTLPLKAGDSVTVHLLSEDGIAHALFIDMNGDSMIGPGDPRSISGTDVIYTFTVPDSPGSHFYFCVIHSGSGSDPYGGGTQYVTPTAMYGSVNVNGRPKTTFAAPTPSASWTGGSSHDVRFNLADEDPPTAMTAWANYTYNGGTQGGPIAGPITGTANPNRVSWTVPMIDAADARVSITAKDATDLYGTTLSSPFEIDSTAPTIVGRLPTPNAVDVARSVHVRADWSEPMNATASGASNALAVRRVSDGAWIPGSVSWSLDRRQATFTPAATWAATTPFEVLVNTTAKDDSDPGNGLAAPDTWQFTTGTVLDLLPTPSGVATSVDASATAVLVTWSAVTDPNVVGFHVYRSATPGGPYTRLTSMALSASGPKQYSDVSVTAGATYYYVVTSVDAGGTESPFSTESAITVVSAAPAPMGDTPLIVGGAIGIGLVLVATMAFLRRRRRGKAAK